MILTNTFNAIIRVGKEVYMQTISKGDVWVGNDGWRVLVTNVTNKYVTFFAGYDTITEEIEMFIKGYTKEL